MIKESKLAEVAVPSRRDVRCARRNAKEIKRCPTMTAREKQALLLRIKISKAVLTQCKKQVKILLPSIEEEDLGPESPQTNIVVQENRPPMPIFSFNDTEVAMADEVAITFAAS